MDWNALSAFIGSLITAAVLLVGHLVTREKTKLTQEQHIIATLTEENSKLRVDIQTYQSLSNAQSNQINNRADLLEQRIVQSEERNIEITEERDVLRDYAHQLRSDVYDGVPPPPRDWPTGVLR